MRIYRIIICVLVMLVYGSVCAPVALYAHADEALIPDSIDFENAKARDLQEVVIKKKKQKYSKKNNPAVDLMQRVRRDRKVSNPRNKDFYVFAKYEKTVLALNEFKESILQKDGRLAKQFNFFSDFIDTAQWTGKTILDVSLKEKVSKIISKKGSDVEIVEGLRSNGLDDDFNKEDIRKLFEDILGEIDIYDNDINLMHNRFVSPLSSIAADYYKYEIIDTLNVGGLRCVELSFVPHNPESFSFNGKLYIPVEDSVKYVKRIAMRVPKAINLNYVDNIFVSQNFIKDSLGNVHKTLDDVCLEMQFIPGTPKLYGTRQVRYSGFGYEEPLSYSGLSALDGKEIVNPDAEEKDHHYWKSARLIPLSRAEGKMGDMMTMLRRKPLLYWGEKFIKVLVNGYITTGNPSKFDIGPVNTFVSHNSVEGWRFRVGGITTPALNPHVFARAHVAYGLKDKKWKYSGELEYSFIRKKRYAREFPVNSIRLSYDYDKDQLGQHYLFTNPDNIFLSFKRMDSDLITYRRLAKLEYNLELRNNLSFGVELRREIQEATQWIPFQRGNGVFDSRFIQTVGRLMIRYAPGEKFVQAATNRKPINFDAPIFLLTHEFGPKGFMGADFALNKTEFSVQKRFWFSSFGYTDVVLKGGIIWSQVQFPALLWQNANISYTIQPESYTLLNPMEFAMDRFASIDLSYYMNGLIFNRIPYVNKLKLREVFTFKGFMGKLSDKNNPEYNQNLYRFPTDAHTAPMGSKPYMEIGVGLDNILTILRVDYVWRLTYLDRPGVDKHGLRVSLHFSF